MEAERSTEEYAPAISPKIIGSENSLMVEFPKIESETIIIRVVIVVRIDLQRVLAIALLASSASVFSASDGVFSSSLILSKITIVALIE